MYYTKTDTEQLNLSQKKHTCGHCHKKAPMYQISTGAATEKIYLDDPDGDEYIVGGHLWDEIMHTRFTWLVLLCSHCEAINFFQLSAFSEHAYTIGMDQFGNDIEKQRIVTKRLYPLRDSSIPQPHSDLPENLQNDYLEALNVYSASPRAASALLRLLLEKLCQILCEELSTERKDINGMIAFLVTEGLPKHIQQSLDIIRVIGNEAVHPGTIDINDNPEIARELFRLINIIVDDQISLPKRKANINKKFKDLPETKLEGIKNRDKK